MRQIKFIQLIPPCVLFHIGTFLISLQRIPTTVSMEGPSATLAGYAGRYYIVSKKKKKSQQAQLPAVQQALQTQKEGGRRGKENN